MVIITMDSKKTVIIATMLMVAVLSGAVLVTGDLVAGVETDTSETPSGSEGDETGVGSGTTVSYKIGDRTFQTTQTGTTITLSTLEALGASAPAGKSFSGWQVGDTETILSAGSTVVAAQVAELYTATFSDIIYTITFDIDGVKTTVTGTYDSAIPADKVPATDKVGFIFGGWKVGDADPIKVLPKITADVTYTALYTTDFKISFVVEGTTILTTSVSECTIPADPSKEGNLFIGWKVGDTVLSTESMVRDRISAATGDIVLTAAWRADTLTVTYMSEDIVVLPVQTVNYGGVVIEPSTVPVKDGFNFIGWTLDGAPFDFDSTITEDIILVAAFAPVPESKATGLDDPVTLTLAVACSMLVVILFGLIVWKRETIFPAIGRRLMKVPKDAGKEEKKE